MNKKIIDALRWRYSVQAFDQNKKVDQGDLETILESGRLSASSYGFEPWKFVVVENPQLRLQLREAAYGQAKVSESSHLIVLARRTDARENIVGERIERTSKTFGVDKENLEDFRNMLQSSIDRQTDEVMDCDMRAQVYIALGTMMETASLLGIDSIPIGGFESDMFDEILGFKKKNLTATVLLAIGYRGDDKNAERPKVRRPFAEVVEFIK